MYRALLIVTFLLVALLHAAASAKVVSSPLRSAVISGRGSSKHKRSLTDVAVSGNLLAYTIDVSIGTPAKTFVLQIDTGSVSTVLFSSACSNCQTHEASYSAAASSSASIIPCSGDARCTSSVCYNSTYQYCGFTIHYGSGSLAGQIVADQLAVSSFSATVELGAILSETTASATSVPVADDADGLMGLAFNNSALACQPNCLTPALDALLTSGGADNVFSLLLGGTTGGILTLGGADSTYYTGALYYVSLLTTAPVGYTTYNVFMYGMLVGGNWIFSANESTSAVTATVDSGTSEILLTTSLFTSFKNYLTSAYSKITNLATLLDGECDSTTPSSFPNLSITFDGVEVTIPPSNYLYEDEGEYCMLITSWTEDYVLLGDPFMRGAYIVFDRVNYRMGFASGASYNTNVTAASSFSSTSTTASSSTSTVATTSLSASSSSTSASSTIAAATTSTTSTSSVSVSTTVSTRSSTSASSGRTSTLASTTTATSMATSASGPRSSSATSSTAAASISSTSATTLSSTSLSTSATTLSSTSLSSSSAASPSSVSTTSAHSSTSASTTSLGFLSGNPSVSTASARSVRVAWLALAIAIIVQAYV